MENAIPAGARPIPGTDYQIAGATIYRPDGQAVSKEEATRELSNVSLPSDSVTVMQGVYGPDFKKSTLPGAGAELVSPDALATTLDEKSETMVIDLKTVLELLHEVMKQQRDTTAKIRDADFSLRIDAMEKSRDEALAGAWARMITGIVVGSFTAVLGGLSIAGGGVGLSKISSAQKGLADGTMTRTAFDSTLAWANSLTQTTQAVGQTGQSLGQIGSSIGEGVSAGYDKASKDADIEATAQEQMVELMRDMVAAAQDMLAAVRQTLRDTQSAEAEASRAVAKV
jgi:hypothetical protein